MVDRRRHVAVADAVEIEPGGEIGAEAVQHHGARFGGKVGEDLFERRDRRVVDGVAFMGTVEADRQHRAQPLDDQRFGGARFRCRLGFGHVRPPRARKRGDSYME